MGGAGGFPVGVSGTGRKEENCVIFRAIMRIGKNKFQSSSWRLWAVPACMRAVLDPCVAELDKH